MYFELKNRVLIRETRRPSTSLYIYHVVILIEEKEYSVFYSIQYFYYTENIALVINQIQEHQYFPTEPFFKLIIPENYFQIEKILVTELRKKL